MAESMHFEPRATCPLTALYAIVDTGTESFHFYVPAYPMGTLQRIGDKLYLFHELPQRPLVIEGVMISKAITMCFNGCAASCYSSFFYVMKTYLHIPVYANLDNSYNGGHDAYHRDNYEHSQQYKQCLQHSAL